MAKKPNYKVFSPLGWVVVVITAMTGPIVENYIRNSTDLGTWAAYASLVIIWFAGVILALHVGVKPSVNKK